MSEPFVVKIIASPVAYAMGVRDNWREAATWVASKLATRFGDTVSFSYFGLFDADCLTLPAAARLPLVLVNGKVLSSGGKLSAVVIRKEVERRLSSS